VLVSTARPREHARAVGVGRGDGRAAFASSRRGSDLPWHGGPLWRHSRRSSKTCRSAAASAWSRAAEEAARSAILTLTQTLTPTPTLTLTLTLTLTRHALLFFGFCGTGFYGLQGQPPGQGDPEKPAVSDLIRTALLEAGFIQPTNWRATPSYTCYGYSMATPS
jgi:hypothetical protein